MLTDARTEPGPRFGVLGALVAVAAVLCLFAFPLGIAAHAAWWLLLAGWNVIG